MLSKKSEEIKKPHSSVEPWGIRRRSGPLAVSDARRLLQRHAVRIGEASHEVVLVDAVSVGAGDSGTALVLAELHHREVLGVGQLLIVPGGSREPHFAPSVTITSFPLFESQRPNSSWRARMMSDSLAIAVRG